MKSFFQKHKSPILWILSVLIFLIIFSILSTLVYFCIEYGPDIFFATCIIIGFLLIALFCILVIHDKLEDKY